MSSTEVQRDPVVCGLVLVLLCSSVLHIACGGTVVVHQLYWGPAVPFILCSSTRGCPITESLTQLDPVPMHEQRKEQNSIHPSRAVCVSGSQIHTLSNMSYWLLSEHRHWCWCPPCHPQAAAGKLSVDGLLQMSSSELQDTMRRLGSNSEDRSRLTAALSCLKSANETGEQPSCFYVVHQT